MRDHASMIKIVDFTSLCASYAAGLFDPMSRYIGFSEALYFAYSDQGQVLYWERLQEDLDQDTSEEYLLQLDTSYDLFTSTVLNQYLSFIDDSQEIGVDWDMDFSAGYGKTIVRYNPR